MSPNLKGWKTCWSVWYVRNYILSFQNHYVDMFNLCTCSHPWPFSDKRQLICTRNRSVSLIGKGTQVASVTDEQRRTQERPLRDSDTLIILSICFAWTSLWLYSEWSTSRRVLGGSPSNRHVWLDYRDRKAAKGSIGKNYLQKCRFFFRPSLK